MSLSEAYCTEKPRAAPHYGRCCKFWYDFNVAWNFSVCPQQGPQELEVLCGEHETGDMMHVLRKLNREACYTSALLHLDLPHIYTQAAKYAPIHPPTHAHINLSPTLMCLLPADMCTSHALSRE
eukprot:557176-Pelagomonas_calceolata.AAC.7